MAFLRAAPVALAPLAKTGSRLYTGGYCGWKRTRRQGSSTSAARSRGLPCLVTLPGHPLGARPDEGLTLPVNVPELFFLLTRDADDREFFGVPRDVTREPLAEHPGIERVGLHPFSRLVELLRRDDLTRRARRGELPPQPEAKAARFIDDKDRVAAGQQRLHPRPEFVREEPPRRLGRGVPLLRHDNVARLVDVQPELDRRDRSLILVVDVRVRGHPCAMNNAFLHSDGELPRSPATFHAT